MHGKRLLELTTSLVQPTSLNQERHEIDALLARLQDSLLRKLDSLERATPVESSVWLTRQLAVIRGSAGQPDAP